MHTHLLPLPLLLLLLGTTTLAAPTKKRFQEGSTWTLKNLVFTPSTSISFTFFDPTPSILYNTTCSAVLSPSTSTTTSDDDDLTYYPCEGFETISAEMGYGVSFWFTSDGSSVGLNRTYADSS